MTDYRRRYLLRELSALTADLAEYAGRLVLTEEEEKHRRGIEERIGELRRALGREEK